MKCFYIINNTTKDKNYRVAGAIREFLVMHGAVCYMDREEPHIPPNVECVIVLGGDGTLLRAARSVIDKELPLLGVNLGTLGYLAEIDLKMLNPALEQVLSGEYTIEKRMMISGSVFRKGTLMASDIALNDIVIAREGTIRVIKYNNYVNGSFLNSYSADGIIISTPTGSTGYSLSAGGPIISPQASLFLMTPLAPHTLNSRSIILPDSDKITIEIGEGRNGCEERAVASFDGATTIEMTSGDFIEVTKADKDTAIIKISDMSFFEILRRKMKNT